MDKAELKQMFLAVPDPAHAETINEFNLAFYKIAGMVMVNTPASAEQTICLRKLQEGLHYAVLALGKQARPKE
jgi:hypothetical protein